MSYQSEAELEQQLINILNSKYGYNFVKLNDMKEVEENFRKQLNELNKENLHYESLSDKEFERVLIYMQGKSVFHSAKILRDKIHLTRDNGEMVYLKLIDFDNKAKNAYQVSNQITVHGKYENRYDVTLLINGLPIVQIELKRRGLNIKEAFNQMCRYARHSYDGLFRFLQILVISNGVDTKYFSNSDKPYQYSLTFFWTDALNNRISNLFDFSKEFLNKNHLIDMISTFTVLNDSDKVMMIMRPYQVHASKAMIRQAVETNSNCFCWHCTGAGKTLTAFKTAQVLSKEPTIKKVIFLIDRQDLDTQTIEEFNKFQPNSVDTTDSTSTLIKQFKEVSTSLIVTTVQKLDNAIKKEKYTSVMTNFKDEKIVFIIDECHRSQFGEMNTRIKKFFNNAQFFGFTGTPRLEANKSQDGRTTADVFGKCIHTYMIKEAILDHNVLGFSVEYITTFKGQYDEKDNERVYGIDTEEVYEDPNRISNVINHIICHHDAKTLQKKYTAIFATSSKKMLIKYYEEFKKLNHNMKIAAIFTYQANEEISEEKEHSRESLEKIIKDYNNTFDCNFSTDTFDAYQKDISKRVKNAEIDILIVVDMFLTGFDSKSLNTLYVDKPLKYHNLLQAYSRTNRIYDSTKVWGNIVCYRNLKEETDVAIRLFNDSTNADEVLQRDFHSYLDNWKECVKNLRNIAINPNAINDLVLESDKEKFILAFRRLAQILLALRTFVEFEFEESLLGLSEQEYEDYKSKYLMLYDEVKCKISGDKVSILQDIDFEIELIQTDRINVEYIMNLLRNMNRTNSDEQNKDIEHILNELNRTDNEQLRKKAELIKNFLIKELSFINLEQNIDDAYNGYENRERDKEIQKFAYENDLDANFIKEHISEYEFTGNINKEKISNSIKMPYVKKRKLTNLLIEFIRDNVFKYQF